MRLRRQPRAQPRGSEPRKLLAIGVVLQTYPYFMSNSLLTTSCSLSSGDAAGQLPRFPLQAALPMDSTGHEILICRAQSLSLFFFFKLCGRILAWQTKMTDKRHDSQFPLPSSFPCLLFPFQPAFLLTLLSCAPLTLLSHSTYLCVRKHCELKLSHLCPI